MDKATQYQMSWALLKSHNHSGGICMSASVAKQIDSELSNPGGYGREIFSRNKSTALISSPALINVSSKKTAGVCLLFR